MNRFSRYLVRAVLVSFLLTGATTGLGADSIRITQIDTSRLLLSQDVNLYLDITDEAGSAVPDVAPEMLAVYESADGETFREVPRILGLRTQPNLTEGIHFLLLLDNSGSMYDSISDQPTTDVSRMKITHAKRAIRTFLSSVTNPRDTIGLATFNTDYRVLATRESDPGEVSRLLDRIERPVPEEAYTELYGSLYLAAEYMEGLAGRKVLIVLSDGENYPYFLHSGNPHPRFGIRLFEPDQVIENALREGMTIFAVRFGEIRDINLPEIAIETGGIFFDAANERELSDVYLEIRNRILREYLLTYRATTIPADRKFVKVTFTRGIAPAEDTLSYYSSVIFGIPLVRLTPLLLIPFVLALLMWMALMLFRYERPATRPTLEILHSGEGKASARIVPLGTNKTVIGGSDKADLTIIGAPSVREEHATVVYDEGSHSYTVIGEGEIRVNNQRVREKRLEPGDVIDVGGTTIVFDTDEISGGEERKD